MAQSNPSKPVQGNSIAEETLPGRKIPVGHGPKFDGFGDHDGDYPHAVEPHVAHSPRTHHK